MSTIRLLHVDLCGLWVQYSIQFVKRSLDHWRTDSSGTSVVELDSGKDCGNCWLTRQTLVKFERYDAIPPSRTQSIVELKRAFEEAGIEFTGSPGEGPGVRLWKTVMLANRKRGGPGARLPKPRRR